MDLKTGPAMRVPATKRSVSAAGGDQLPAESDSCTAKIQAIRPEWVFAGLVDLGHHELLARTGRRWLSSEPKSRAPADRDPDERRVEEEFRQALGTQVAFRRRSGGNGGTLTIQVYSEEEMDALYQRLVGDDGW